MKRFLSVSIVLAAACGGGSKNQPTTTDNTVPDDTATRPADTGGDSYGGASYGGAAYGGGTYAAMDEGKMGPTPVNPQGHWVSACLPGAKKNESMRLTFDILPTRWTMAMESFGTGDCKKRRAVANIAGGWTIQDASTTVPGAWNAVFTFDTRTLTPDDSKSAKAFAKTCGIKKLTAKKANDIHASGCPALGMLPSASCTEDHDLVAIVDNQLQFGVRPADGNMCTADKRPAALETSLGLTFSWSSFGIKECDEAAAAIDKARACQAVPPDAKAMIDEQLRYLWTMVAPAGDPAASAEDKQTATQQCTQIRDGLQQTLSQIGC